MPESLQVALPPRTRRSSIEPSSLTNRKVLLATKDMDASTAQNSVLVEKCFAHGANNDNSSDINIVNPDALIEDKPAKFVHAQYSALRMSQVVSVGSDDIVSCSTNDDEDEQDCISTPTALKKLDTSSSSSTFLSPDLPVKQQLNQPRSMPLFQVETLTEANHSRSTDQLPFTESEPAFQVTKYRRYSHAGESIAQAAKWDKALMPRRSSLSGNQFTMPELPKTPAKLLSEALYTLGARTLPPRRRSTTCAKSRRVSFSFKSNLVCEAYGPFEYDRSGVPSEYELGNFDQVRREIVDFCENEMQVHEDSRDSIYHPWLKPAEPATQKARRSSVSGIPPSQKPSWRRSSINNSHKHIKKPLVSIQYTN